MTKFKILIVEDEALLAADIGDSLEDMGYDVVGYAASGANAIKLVIEKNPDLVLMDIQLQGEMDGIEAAKQIHETHNCAIIFQTAFAEDPLLERATKAEPYGYLVKPVGERELKAVIKMAIYKRQMEAEREKLIAELTKAKDEISSLQEIMPICAWCKKIRDDDGFWANIEDYFAKHTDTKFTHGICPDCMKEMLNTMPKRTG